MPLIPFPAPYTYDDPRILYDEHCFFYDGGYDLICLYGKIPTEERIRHRGGVGFGSPGKQKHVYPQADTLELIFKTTIISLNGQPIDDEKEKTTIYKIKKNFDIKIKVQDMTFKTKDTTVKSILMGSFEKNLSENVSSSLYFNKPNKIKITSTIITKQDPNK